MNHRRRAARRAPKTVIVIHRERFALHLHQRDPWLSSNRYTRIKYPIAVGKIGDATPTGVYYIDAKTLEPDWLIPENPDYPRESWGTTVAFDNPANPFAGGFLSISGGEGVGMHGTKGDPKLGTRASHGCIRMNVSDFLKVYRKAPLGAPVVIV